MKQLKHISIVKSNSITIILSNKKAIRNPTRSTLKRLTGLINSKKFAVTNYLYPSSFGIIIERIQ